MLLMYTIVLWNSLYTGTNESHEHVVIEIFNK